MIVVKEITFSGGSCPFQLEGKTVNDEDIYVRYRWGCLRVEINGKTILSKQIGEDQNDEEELALMREHGESKERIAQTAETFKKIRAISDGRPLCFDGYMNLDQLRIITKDEIQWPYSC